VLSQFLQLFSANHHSTIAPDFCHHPQAYHNNLDQAAHYRSLGFQDGSFISHPALGWLQGKDIFPFNFIAK
jgi:hypothetical protein